MPTVNIRSVPEDVRARFNAGASLRGLTLAEYLEALLDLHDRMRRLASAGDLGSDYVQVDLDALGLQTVHASG